MSSSNDKATKDSSEGKDGKKAPKLSKDNPYYHKSHDYIYKDHADLEKKERELDMSYSDIHSKLEALIVAVMNYEDNQAVINLTNAIGTGVVQAEKKRKDLFLFFDHEDKHLEHLLDDKHLNQMYKDVREKKHHHHHRGKEETKAKRASIGDRAISPSKSDERNRSGEKFKANGAENIKKQGSLIKKNGMRNKWSKRYFVIEGIEMRYYESEEQKIAMRPKAIIPLTKAKIVTVIDGKESPTRFQLNYGDGKSILLESKDEQEKKEWVAVIATIIETAPVQHKVTKNSNSSKSH